jgi:hypothetical protein
MIQLALSDAAYGSALRRLLEIQGSGAVEFSETANFNRAGVLVLDAEHLRRIALPIPHPERVVLIAGNRSEDMAAAWKAGLQTVVLREDPLSTAVLAVMAASLGIPDGADQQSEITGVIPLSARPIS